MCGWGVGVLDEGVCGYEWVRGMGVGKGYVHSRVRVYGRLECGCGGGVVWHGVCV